MDQHNKINYSQCWEDPDVLVKSLKVTELDDILSVTSGGDNVLTLALENPKSITAIDVNPTQNYLLELKLAAIKNLEYKDFLEFLGVHTSMRRTEIFSTLKQNLSDDSRKWWENNLPLIKNGIIHAGKFENYLAFFRTKVLPFIHSEQIIHKLLSLKTAETQKRFYDENWDTLRWRLIFRLFFNKTFLDWFGRAPQSFTYTQIKDVASHYLKRTGYALTEVSVVHNYFLHFILTGTYLNHDDLPPYLKQKNFGQLKDVVDKIKIVTCNVAKFLSSRHDDSFSKFNFSDIFETMSDDQKDALFKNLVRAGRNGSIIVYWNNLVERHHPGFLDEYILADAETANALHQNDRTFFYSRLIIESIKK